MNTILRERLRTSVAKAVATLMTIAMAACLTAALAQTKSKSLYERLGGYDAISAVVDDFAPKLFNDPKIARFFAGMSTDSRNQFMQKNKNLVCKVTGGPCEIISRPAKTAHAGLGISEADFNTVAKHLVDTLNKFKVPATEQKELLAIIDTLKPDIVEKR